MDTDKFSALPEVIAQKILNHLEPKDVARTIVFSKRWKDTWNSLPSLDYDQKRIQGDGGNQKFINYVENSLATRINDPSAFIEKFRLNITSLTNQLTSRMFKWLHTVIAKNVRDLEICVKAKKKNRRYCLPNFVLKAEEVTSLKLNGCWLFPMIAINLPNIRVLSIKKVDLYDDSVNSIITNCPLIEDLRFVFCNQFRSLNITTLLKLKRIEVHECHGLKEIEIKLQNLESFWFHANRSKGECRINLNGCNNLKTLTLKYTYMTDEMLAALLEEFPNLEKLVLKECNELRRVSVFSAELEVLVLLRCQSLREVVINASNLYSFEYTGTQIPFSDLNVPSLIEAKILFEQDDAYFTAISANVLSFLTNLAAKGLKLVVFYNQRMYMYEDLTNLHIEDFVVVKLELTMFCSRVKERFGGMMRDFFPEKLYVISSPDSELLQFVRENVMEAEEANLSCCTYYQRKCWRHHLRHVRTLPFEKDEFICLRVRLSPELTTIFKFEWKSRDEYKETNQIVL